MKDILDLDIETFSTVELKKSNVYAYTEDPMFEVLMCGWSLNGSPVEVWEGEHDIAKIPGLFDRDVVKVAHNAGFERICFSRMAGMPVGEYIEPEQYFDTAAVASLHGYPRSLEGLAKALEVTPKDTAGARLIGLFCKPYRGKRIMPEDKPEEWEQFKKYCAQDVDTMQKIRIAMRGWPSDGFERSVWYADQRINDRGIRVDLDLARAAVEAAKQNNEKMSREVIEITGISNANSTPQLSKWCEEQGFPMPNWQAPTVTERLLDSRIPENVEKVLRLRQELALVAHRKFEAVLRGVSLDGRLRGQFVYHSAHTGRWSSKGVQVHNLPRLSFDSPDKDGEKVYDESKERLALLDLEYGFGASPQTLKKLVRPLFLLNGTSSDLSAIEARVLAWLAGEDWVLQAFEEGRDLYVETADRMGGGMGRPEGKIAVLAAGYQGSVGSFRAMGYGGRRCPLDYTPPTPKEVKGKPTKQEHSGNIAESKMNLAKRAKEGTRDPHDVLCHKAVDVHASRVSRMKHLSLKEKQQKMLLDTQGSVEERVRHPNHKCDVEIKEIVDAWRDANPCIREFWYDLEHKFWTGGIVSNEKIQVKRKGNKTRFVFLPSGRVLKYYGVHKRGVEKTDPDTGEVIGHKEQLFYTHVRGYPEKTYGGRLTENVTQAVARDVLADDLLRLEKAGYFVVGHVHDEALTESKDTEGIREIMRTGPDWAAGLPLDASANVLYRYRKD